MEKDLDGFLRPVTGVFELNLETKIETLKQKIAVTNTDTSSVSVIETFSATGEVEHREEITKKIAPVVVESQQKNVKDQHAQVKKKFVKSNEDVDTNAQLADQKLRNAKALALVKEKERIAKE